MIAHVAACALYLLGDRLLTSYANLSLQDHVGFLWALSGILGRFFELTADAAAIEAALELEERAAVLAREDPVLVALSQHNFAITGLKALDMYDDAALGNLTSLTSLRGKSLEAAEIALATVRATKDRRNADLQAARIEYVIADLLRTGSPTRQELDRAIEIFDRLVKRRNMIEAGHIRIGRMLAILQRGPAGNRKLFDQALKALNDEIFGYDVLKLGRRSRWATFLGRLFLQDGVDQEVLHRAMPFLQSAVTFAQKDTLPLFDPNRLTRDAEQQASAYSSLAVVYTLVGWPNEAMSLIETWRGNVLSSRRLSEADRRHAAFEADEKRDKRFGGMWQLDESPFLVLADEDVTFRQALGPFHEDYELEGFYPALEKFQSAPEHKRTLLVELALEEFRPDLIVASAMANATNKSKGMNGWFPLCWLVDPDDLVTLRSSAHVRPSAFREERLQKLVRVGAKALLQPMQSMFSATKPDLVVLSLPGALSNLPFEAFAEAAREVDPKTQWPTVFAYAPSLKIVMDSGLPPPLGTDARVLVVSYNDKDLPNAEAEVAAIVDAFKGRAEVLRNCTKRLLIEALNRDFQAVHFVCHGTYDPGSPLRSTLVLRRIGNRDVDRLTAAEIIEFVRFQQRPIVTLSACSSALTADSRTNTWAGLPGSLIEAGAHCVIGSRWPVDDDIAQRTMVEFYRSFIGSRKGVAATLRAAQEEIRKNGAIKDWACFGALHG
jgi:hypothetical protein